MSWCNFWHFWHFWHFCHKTQSILIFSFLIQRMIFRSSAKSEHTLPSSWKTPPKQITPLCFSPVDSSQKSASTTHLSSRSNSTKKILIPKSSQLDQFFHQSRHRSAQKHLTARLVDNYYNSPKNNEEINKEKRQRVEFLRQNINNDYFEMQSHQQPKFFTKKQEEMFGKGPKIFQKPKAKDANPIHPADYFAINREKKAVTTRNEPERPPSRTRSPKVPPILKVMSPKGKKMLKIGSAKSFQYTFGFN